jgi:hypothetical protein
MLKEGMMSKVLRRDRTGLGWIGGLLLLGALLPIAAVADDNHDEADHVFQYAAKFVCGESTGDPDPVMAGDYATTINFRNPTLSVVPLRALVLASYVGGAVVDAREAEMPIRTELEALEARQVGCEQILARVLDSDGLFVEGWVVILAKRSIDVSVVYTASGDGEVALDIQEVSERVVKRHMHDPKLVEICHFPPGNPDNAHTIWVEESDVPAHISAHDDHEGACVDDGIAPEPEPEQELRTRVR